MKVFVALLTCIFPAIISLSQTDHLIIRGETGKLYLEHTVVAKENWYSVGRLYNISPKEIAPFNTLTIDKPLEIGQLLKIPMTSGNFSQKDSKAADETLVPVYHTIQDREWLYHISNIYNKVPVESLEKWNHVSRDQARAGMDLIVGYLKVKTALSAFAGSGADKTTVAAVVPVKKEETKPATATVSAVKEDKNADQSTKITQTANHIPASLNTIKPAVTSAGKAPENTYSSNHSDGGFFSVTFTGNSKSSGGQAATFRSSSGWHDGKYYALMNNVPVGTIIKVTSPATNKSVYAKVLGQLPDMKESAGLAIRISNAAAAELGTGEGKFPVEIKY